MAGQRIRGRHPAPDGFTLLELVIALIVGVMVMAAAMVFVIQEMRSLAGRELRESLSRNGRYIGVSVRHDLQRAGIEISSTMSFGSVSVWPGTVGDTLVILHVPYRPEVAPPHSLIPPAGDDNPLPPGGTCGSRCLDLTKVPPDVMPLELQPGNLARLQIPGQRHLILVEQVDVTSETSFQLAFTQIDTVLRQPASMSGGLQLDRFSTFVQAVKPIMYYLDDEEQLMRATGLNFDGSPAGHVLAYGVEEFEVSFVFADGDELDRADPFDSDDTNDFDDVVSVTVRATLRADHADPRVNSGELLRRNYKWTVSPRNLRYEKSRQ